VLTISLVRGGRGGGEGSELLQNCDSLNLPSQSPPLLPLLSLDSSRFSLSSTIPSTHFHFDRSSTSSFFNSLNSVPHFPLQQMTGGGGSGSGSGSGGGAPMSKRTSNSIPEESSSKTTTSFYEPFYIKSSATKQPPISKRSPSPGILTKMGLAQPSLTVSTPSFYISAKRTNELREK